MTSCKHDAALITYFLLEMLRSGAPIPRIAVCDFSKAILIALSRAFAKSADLSDYFQTCYNILLQASLLTCTLTHTLAQNPREKKETRRN